MNVVFWCESKKTNDKNSEECTSQFIMSEHFLILLVKRLILEVAFDIFSLFKVTITCILISIKAEIPCVWMALLKAFFIISEKKNKTIIWNCTEQPNQTCCRCASNSHRDTEIDFKSSSSWASCIFFFLTGFFRAHWLWVTARCGTVFGETSTRLGCEVQEQLGVSGTDPSWEELS